MPLIHPTALIDSAAELASDVSVGAYAIVESGVSLAAGVTVEAQAQLLRGTRVGAGSVIGRGAVIGGLPQDVSFDPATPTGVRIGERNVLREHVTIHRATQAGSDTVLGDDNYLMVGVHVGHDAVVGGQNIFANSALVAGHVQFGSRSVVGGGAVFHQFIRVGDCCMVQGASALSKDLPPYAMASELNRLVGLNVVGMRRAGFSAATRAEIKSLFVLLWRSGRNLSQAVAAARQKPWNAEAEQLLAFVEGATKKGVCPWRSRREVAE